MKKLSLMLVFLLFALLVSPCCYGSYTPKKSYSDGFDEGYSEGYADGYEAGRDAFLKKISNDPLEYEAFVDSLYDDERVSEDFGHYFTNRASEAAEDQVGLDLEQVIYTIYNYEMDIYPEKNSISATDYKRAVYYLFYFAEYFHCRYYDD